MHVLGTGLRQSIADGLHDDRVIVITGIAEGGGKILNFLPNCDDKATKVIHAPTCLRCNIIRQAATQLPFLFLPLLAQEMECGQDVRPRFIRVHFNILARTIRRPKTRYATSSTTLVHNNVLKHLLTIGKQFLGLFTFLRFVKNRRINTMQLPGPKEGGPVDVCCQHI